MTSPRNSQEENNSSPQNDALISIFEILFGGQQNFTFYIAVDSPNTDRVQIFQNNTVNIRTPLNNLLTGNLLLNEANINNPFSITRNFLRILNNGPTDPVNQNAPQFIEYIQEILSAIKRKDRVRHALKKNKPYSYKLKNGKPEECTICLNEFKQRERIRKLDCEHEFHKKCIDKWLLEGGNHCCPICRKEPFSEKVEESNSSK